MQTPRLADYPPLVRRKLVSVDSVPGPLNELLPEPRCANGSRISRCDKRSSCHTAAGSCRARSAPQRGNRRHPIAPQDTEGRTGARSSFCDIRTKQELRQLIRLGGQIWNSRLRTQTAARLNALRVGFRDSMCLMVLVASSSRQRAKRTLLIYAATWVGSLSALVMISALFAGAILDHGMRAKRLGA